MTRVFQTVSTQVLHEIPADFGCYKVLSPDVGKKWEMVILYLQKSVSG